MIQLSASVARSIRRTKKSKRLQNRRLEKGAAGLLARASVRVVAVFLQTAPLAQADDIPGLNRLDEELPAVADVKPGKNAQMWPGPRVHVMRRKPGRERPNGNLRVTERRGREQFRPIASVFALRPAPSERFLPLYD